MNVATIPIIESNTELQGTCVKEETQRLVASGCISECAAGGVFAPLRACCS